MSILTKPLPSHGNREWKVSSPPDIEPISVEEAKAYAKIDSNNIDSLLAGLIQSVREYAEDYLGRAFISQSVTMVMDYWPGMTVELPRPPLLSITGIYTLDEEDEETEYDSDNYYAITEAIPGKIILKQGVTAPENTDRDYAGFKIVWKAGYGVDPSDVPSPIRDAMKIWVTELEAGRLPDPKDPPPKAKALLDIFRVIGVIVR